MIISTKALPAFENQMPSVQACEFKRQFLNYNCFFIFLFSEQESRFVVNHGILFSFDINGQGKLCYHNNLSVLQT